MYFVETINKSYLTNIDKFQGLFQEALKKFGLTC